MPLTGGRAGREMPAMKPALWFCAGAVVWAGLGPAPLVAGEAPAGSLPPLDTVLSRYVEALGGRARLEGLTSRHLEGEVELSLLPGKFSLRLLARAPDRQVSVITLPDGSEIREGYDGTNGWVKNPWLGVADRPAVEQAKVRRDARFHRELELRTLYPDLAVVRVDRSGPVPWVVVESRPDARSKERFYFDQHSGLLVRQDSEFESSTGPVSATAEYDDYREVASGVRVPHTVRITARGNDGPELELKLTVNNVEHNVPVEAAEFLKPAP